MALVNPKLEQQNAAFWSELCGTGLARQLGITDDSPRSLRRFDDWYLAYYPYLTLHVPFTEMTGLDVLEIGLGYGTLSQKLAEWGARYTGLDIAPGPVQIVNTRLRNAKLPGKAIIGSILKAPFEDEFFDRVITIGCLHHTGDLAKSIDECWRVLRPGGQLIMMVYNAYSIRRWNEAPAATAKLWLKERFGFRGPLNTEEATRAKYDSNTKGEVAPHIDVTSVTSLRALCSKFKSFRATRENITTERPFSRRTRIDLLKTIWPRIGGLDIYATCTK
jgi:SAM-dependent methyltransferase